MTSTKDNPLEIKKKIKLDIISGTCRSETVRGGYMGLVTAVGCDINIETFKIRPKFPEILGGGVNRTDIFRNFIPKFWVFFLRLA